MLLLQVTLFIKHLEKDFSLQNIGFMMLQPGLLFNVLNISQEL